MESEEGNNPLKLDKGGDAAHTDAMRRELSVYLDDVKHKMDTDGNPLLSYPKNFDSIVAAMDRGDIVAEQEKPWSKYLLDQNFGIGEFEQGRYDGLDDSADAKTKADVDVQKGLAEIEMLDRQLRAAGRRNNQTGRGSSRSDNSIDSKSRQSTPGRHALHQEQDKSGGISLADMPFLNTNDDDGDNTGDVDNSAPNTGRSSVASSAGGMYGGGRTFMTRLKSDVYAGEDSSSSRQTSARSHINSSSRHEGGYHHQHGSPSSRGTMGVDLADSLLYDDNAHAMTTDTDNSSAYAAADMERALGGLERPPIRLTNNTAGVGVGGAKKNYLNENRQIVQRIDPATQMRVSALLGFDDNTVEEGADMSEIERLADEAFEAEWGVISQYGYSAEERQYMDGLDKKLADLREPSAGSSSSGDGHSEPATDHATEDGKEIELEHTPSPGKKNKHQPNYLIEQRAGRTREAYTQQLDLAIRSLKRPMTSDLLAALVVPESYSENEEDGIEEGSSYRHGVSKASSRHPSGSSTSMRSRGSRHPGSSRRSSGRGSRGSGCSVGMGKSHSVRDLPAVEDVSPTHMITMEEVYDVISELCHQQQSSQTEEQESDTGSLTGPSSTTTITSSTVAVASRTDLDALLSRLRPDIIQLATMRNQLRDQATRQHRLMQSQLEVAANTVASGGGSKGEDGGADLQWPMGMSMDMESVQSLGQNAPLGVEDVAGHASQFAQDSAAAATALSAHHKAIAKGNKPKKASKSNKIRSEVGAMKGGGGLFDPRDFISVVGSTSAKSSDGTGRVIGESDFDLSRKSVANDMQIASTRPSIRMRAEQSSRTHSADTNPPTDIRATGIRDTDIATSRGHAYESSSAHPRSYGGYREDIDEDEVIYSAPSSAQSSRRQDDTTSVTPSTTSFYQSSRRQVAAREQVRSRESRSRDKSAEEAMSNSDFLPALAGPSSRPTSSTSSSFGTITAVKEGRKQEGVPTSDSVRSSGASQVIAKVTKKEPRRNIGSKFTTAVVQPDISVSSDSPLKAMRNSNVTPTDANSVDVSDRNKMNIRDHPSAVSLSYPVDPRMQEKKEDDQTPPPSREMKTISSGLDDVYGKLNRLLARADRVHDVSDDDDATSVDQYMINQYGSGEGCIYEVEDEVEVHDGSVASTHPSSHPHNRLRLGGNRRIDSESEESDNEGAVIDNAHLYQETGKDGEFVVI